MAYLIDTEMVYLELGLTSPTDQQKAIVTLAITRAEGAIKRYLRYDPYLASGIEFYPQKTQNSLPFSGVWDTQGNQAVLRATPQTALDELILGRIPIRSVTELKVDYNARSGSVAGSFGSDTIWTEGTEFWPNYDAIDVDGNKICTDGILRSYGGWPIEPGTVKVTYTAGYTKDEFFGQGGPIDASPIMNAVLVESTRLAKKAFINAYGSLGFAAGPKTSERLGDYSYTIDASLASKLYGNEQGITNESKEALNDFVHWGVDL